MTIELRNAPVTLYRALDIVLSGVRWKIYVIYLEDMVLF